jgi:hypothetical protein
MRVIKIAVLSLLLAGFHSSPAKVQGQELHVVPDGVQTRWSSFENPKAEKGHGGAENKNCQGSHL